jgi:N6-adenosine-specific RNA methylase IME4
MKYAAIIADPPWRYDSPSAIVGTIKKNGEPSIQVNVEKQYATMSLAEIKALNVPSADDSILFMWVTNPFLCDGSGAEVVRSWGFTPKTVITWAKVKHDSEDTPSMRVGHWFRSASEHVIVGTRGKIRRPDNFPALPTWFTHTRLPHSVKPDVIHQWAEIAAPCGPYLEMFARRSRPGWDLWGNQVPASSSVLD